MKPQHIALGILTAAIWGFNFVTIKYSLQSFPPLLLTALRFLIAAAPAFFIKKPDLPWGKLAAIALPLFLGQFVFLFLGMVLGMPPGMASITLQLQAFFTILIAAVLLREKPTAPQLLGITVALGGLGLIAFTIGGDVTLAGLFCTVCAAASWATRNVLLRQSPQPNIFALMVWLSVIIPIPALALSAIFEGPQLIGHALTHASFISVISLVYISVVSTLIGFGLWGYLLKHYPAGTVAPFSLLVPIFGMISAFLVFGEHFAPLRLLGAALILAGLAVIILLKAKPQTS